MRSLFAKAATLFTTSLPNARLVVMQPKAKAVKSVFLLKKLPSSYIPPLGWFDVQLCFICCSTLKLTFCVFFFLFCFHCSLHPLPPLPSLTRSTKSPTCPPLPSPPLPSPYPPTQTRTASPAPPASACQTGRRTSWTASSRWSGPGRHPCPSGGRALCRPGWRLSWRCPCTSAAAQKMSRAER